MVSEKELEAIFNDVLGKVSKIEAIPEYKVEKFSNTGKNLLKGTLPKTDAVAFEKAELDFVRSVYDHLEVERSRWEDAITQSDAALCLAKTKYSTDSALIKHLMTTKKNHEINFRYYNELYEKFVDFYLVMILRTLHLKKLLKERPLYPLNDLNAYALPVPEEVPDHIRTDLECARKCLAYNLLTPTLVMCRRALEGSLIEKYKELEKKDPQCKDGAPLKMPELYDWAVKQDLVRSKYGNFVAELSDVGIHPKDVEFDEKTALSHLNSTITLATDIYK